MSLSVGLLSSAALGKIPELKHPPGIVLNGYKNGKSKWKLEITFNNYKGASLTQEDGMWIAYCPLGDRIGHLFYASEMTLESMKAGITILSG